MNIGIMTFHRAVNYGAVLQAYALQYKIEQLGHHADIIDYRCPFIESEVSATAGFQKKIGFSSAMKQFVFRTVKNKSFDKFMNRYLHLTPAYLKQEELKDLSSKYDAFITGSDQVWNYGCSGSDTSYFLDFAEKKNRKIAYAASFGYDTLPAGDPFDYKKLLSDFHAISVREKSGSTILKNKIENETCVTLDPTLLLTKEDWKKLVLDRPIKEKYIFVYYIRESKDLLNYAYQFAEKRGYKVINSKKSIEFLKKCSPQDFLTWIYHSEYFITNSFHGTVFSILFEKQFAVELDNGKSVNNRSKELLETVGICNREIDMKNMEQIDDKIDFESALLNLDKERTNSIDFIRNSLS